MADKDVNIRIGTEADTSGAEKAKKAIDEVSRSASTNSMTDGSQLLAVKKLAQATKEQSDAVEDLTSAVRELSQEEQDALKAQQDADVERAKSLRRLREEADQANSGFDRLFNQQRLIGIGQQLQGLSQAAGEFYRQFRETEQGKEILAGLSEEATVLGSTLTSVTTSAAAGFAVGGPIGAGIGALTGLVKSFGDEWLSTNKRIEDSNRELDQAIAESKARMEERARVAKDDGIRKKLAQELAEIEKQNAAIERQKAIREAQEGLDAARNRLGNTRAAGAGTSRDEAAIQRIGDQADAAAADIAQRLADKKVELEQLGAAVHANASAFVEAAGKTDDIMTSQRDEAVAFRKAMERLESMTADYEAMAQEAGIRMETVQVDATTKLEETGNRLRESLATSAAGLQSALDAEVQEQGDRASIGAKNALADLSRILADKSVSEQEVTELQQLMERLIKSNEAKDKAVQDNINKILTNTDTFLRILQQQMNRAETIEREINTMEARARSYITH